MQQALKERNAKDAELIGSSTSSTDEVGTELAMDEDMEEIIRDETRNWLAEYGAKFFSIETAKFNATEARRRNLKSHR